MILTELFFLVVYLSLVGGLFGVVSLLPQPGAETGPCPCGSPSAAWPSMGFRCCPPRCGCFPPSRSSAAGLPHGRAGVGDGVRPVPGLSVTRLLLAGKSLRRRPPCQNQRLLGLAAQCAQSLGRKRTPPLLETPLDAPISVAGALRPVLLVDTATFPC